MDDWERVADSVDASICRTILVAAVTAAGAAVAAFDFFHRHRRHRAR